MQTMYWLAVMAYTMAGATMLAGLVVLLTLDVGRWWAREKPQPQQWGEGRTIPQAGR